jgi:putative transposase
MKIYHNQTIPNRRSIRLKNFDYSKEGLYFITICCHERKCHFGKIERQKMVFNNVGKIANECWLEIPKHFPDVVLHEYVIMPNHIHGIIEIPVGANQHSPNNNNNNNNNHNKLLNHLSQCKTNGDDTFNQHSPTNVGRANSDSPLRFRSPSNTIGSIIRGYKIGVTKWCRNNTNIQTVWQRNYYDHIIRNENALKRISEYIVNNPVKWSEDRFHK